MCKQRTRPLLRLGGGIILVIGLLGLAWPATVSAQSEAAQAYEAAYDLVIDEDWSAAADALRDFVRQYPRSDWVDDAEFWQCYVLEQAERSPEQAFDCYHSFVKEQPRSKWTDDAKSNVIRIGRGLVRSGKREYQAIVESMQENGDDEVKLAALDALWQMGDERALEAVLDLYATSSSERYKKKIVFVLSQFDDARAADKLKEIALDDPEPQIRKEAIFWLSQRDGAEVISLLEEIAKEEDDVEVQKQVVFAYSQLGREGVPQLIDMARGHRNAEVRKDAIFWLSQMGGSEALTFFDELIDASDDEEVQKQLVFAFSQLGQEAVPRLIRIARAHKSREVQKDAIFWLSQQGGAEVLDFFDELIDASGDEEVQKQLVFAFSQLGREAVPRLIRIARTHRSREVQKDALFWLGQEGGAEVLDFFDEFIDMSSSLEVQKQIVFAYSQLGREGVPRLIEVAKSHRDPEVRKDAIFWLGQSDDERAREALLEIVRGQ
ncbi:MAG: HEAT repeat domain-containing protein [Rhodothermales bacterium]